MTRKLDMRADDRAGLSQSTDRLPTLAPMGDSDAALVARIRGGDVGAFEDMVRAYAQPLATFAWRYLRREEDAADLAQDVFAHVWEHRRELTVTASLRAYLFATVRNRALNALDHARVEARWCERSAFELLDAPPPPLADERLEQAELRTAVQRALGTLPPRAQEIARLRWIDRLSRREIAQILGVATPTVSVHLTRALKRLRRLLRGLDQ
jgi:RNA polymerase sigma-70 factor (ECF subfamily)